MDTCIGYPERPPALANGQCYIQSYIQTARPRVPDSVSGRFHVFVVCDLNWRLFA